MRNPIILALDLPTAAEALTVAQAVVPWVRAFKVGKELFVSSGPRIVEQLRATGASVFLDLKFHDIPNTVAKAVAAAVRLDVQMLTVHCSGGRAMLSAAEAAAQNTASALGIHPPLVLGVTVLTSMDSHTLAELGGETNPAVQVERLAGLAVDSGLRGLVCSPRELAQLRPQLPEGIQYVTPGIRTGAEPPDDQKRTLSPQEAMEAGATWLVIGRPIYAAPNPAEAAHRIWTSIQATPLEVAERNARSDTFHKPSTSP